MRHRDADAGHRSNSSSECGPHCVSTKRLAPNKSKQPMVAAPAYTPRRIMSSNPAVPAAMADGTLTLARNLLNKQQRLGATLFLFSASDFMNRVCY